MVPAVTNDLNAVLTEEFRKLVSETSPLRDVVQITIDNWETGICTLERGTGSPFYRRIAKDSLSKLLASNEKERIDLIARIAISMVQLTPPHYVIPLEARYSQVLEHWLKKTREMESFKEKYSVFDVFENKNKEIVVLTRQSPAPKFYRSLNRLNEIEPIAPLRGWELIRYYLPVFHYQNNLKNGNHAYQHRNHIQ